jgi:hypothetical protein
MLCFLRPFKKRHEAFFWGTCFAAQPSVAKRHEVVLLRRTLRPFKKRHEAFFWKKKPSLEEAKRF